MKNLWAPWRIEYILGEKEEDCLFCRCLESDQDEVNLVLLREARCFCMLNRYPYNGGHLMIAPIRHCSRLSQLDSQELCEMMEMAQRLEVIMQKAMSPDGFNFGFNLGKPAGAGIEDHLHMHLVPRWAGDTNFMPVLDDTRIVPQALSDCYRFLKEALDKEEGEP